MNVPIEVFDKVEIKDAKSFLTKDRLDLICKYQYIVEYMSWKDSAVNNFDIMSRMYKKHILYRNADNLINYNVLEPVDPFIPDQKEKSTLEDYTNSFNELIESFNNNSFDKKYPIVYSHNGLITGSHRIACCLYFDLPVFCFNIGKKRTNPWGELWFKNHFFSEKEITFLKNKLEELKNE